MAEPANPAWTALHHAVTESDTLEDARQALAAGVEVDSRTDDGFAATALHRAAGHGRLPGMIRLLASAGADVNARNSKGRTPLHLAYRYGAPTWIVEELLDCGADIGALDDRSLTPLDLTDPTNR